jgi:hypothetical protein
VADEARPKRVIVYADEQGKEPFTPRSRGCGTRQCILLRCHSLIPSWIDAHSLTDDQMMVLDAMALEARRILHAQLHQHDRGKEGEDHGCCRRGRWPLIPGDLLGMIAEIEAHLPLEHGLHEQPPHCEPCQGGNPFGFLSPHRTDGRRVFAPAKAWCYGDMLLLIGLE